MWGFLFNFLGVIVVLIERDKKEHDEIMANGGKSITFWLITFLAIGIVLLGVLFYIWTR